MAEKHPQIVLVVRVLQFALCDSFSARVDDIFVRVRNDMQYCTVVGRIGVMMVLIPIGGVNVYLNIAYPILSIDADMCMAKICACMCVVLSHGYNLNGASIRGVLWKPSPKVLLPYVVEKYLWHSI